MAAAGSIAQYSRHGAVSMYNWHGTVSCGTLLACFSRWRYVPATSRLLCAPLRTIGCTHPSQRADRAAATSVFLNHTVLKPQLDESTTGESAAKRAKDDGAECGAEAKPAAPDGPMTLGYKTFKSSAELRGWLQHLLKTARCDQDLNEVSVYFALLQQAIARAR